jgi:hypothetical protein
MRAYKFSLPLLKACGHNKYAHAVSKTLIDLQVSMTAGTGAACVCVRN